MLADVYVCLVGADYGRALASWPRQGVQATQHHGRHHVLATAVRACVRACVRGTVIIIQTHRTHAYTILICILAERKCGDDDKNIWMGPD